MKRITWNNLTPPGYQSKDIVDFLLKPAIFDNPELKDKIQASSFYKREGNAEPTNFSELLQKGKIARTRLFSYPKNADDSRSISERMLHLLLTNTVCENIPYDMNSFPIRHEFKRQWIKILTPFDDLTSENLKTDSKGQHFYNNRRILTAEEVNLYKEYICALLGDENGQRFYNNRRKKTETDSKKISLEEKLDKCPSKRKTKRQLEDIIVNLYYGKKQKSLSSLILDIPPCNYDSDSCYEKDAALYSQFEEHDNLFFERLSSLSIIASVWYIWENASNNTFYQEELLRLANMIFPTFSLSEINPSPQKGADNGTATETNDTKKAEKKLEEIKALVNSHEFRLAGAKCEEIFLTYKNASDNIIGKALSYLIMCCENNYKIPPYFKSIESIVREAINYNSPYISKEKIEIKERPQRSVSNVKGVYTINCNYENSISDLVTTTAPIGWEKIVSTCPESTLTAKKYQRILLVNDNYDINLLDAINVLDKIKVSISKHITSISDWENLELFIRCNESEVAQLLDTVLSYFTESKQLDKGFSLFKIYLIDEAKRSADYLFAQHPHFFPLTLARNNGEESKCIHIVLATNNSNPKYSEWLIKEAFWTLPRFDSKISTKISVISPNATQICDSITAECPGLAAFSSIDGKKLDKPFPIEIDDIPFPLIEYKTVSFSTRALPVELDKLWTPSDFLYYIVDSSSDIAGIKVAVQIREHTIRNSVIAGHSGNYSKYNATVAVRCLDPNLAGLAKELIVPKEEEHGKQWFNDYNFITFGSRDSIYSWNQLSGGIIETISQCIHLQYCNAAFDKKNCCTKLNSYFNRLYNHDSSFGAAVSLPYRLFEAGVIPDPWFIQNGDAWWNEDIRKELAESYKDKMKADDLLGERLAQYEHMRWCCFQLTRGWLPVTDDKVVQFITAGATRHVLQIAKLHPCLCSWKQLYELHRHLSIAARRKINEYENVKSEDEIRPYLDKKFIKYYSFEEDYSYFQQLDYKNIEETDLIIKTAWNTLANSEENEKQ